jgi:hypothetical protein
MTLLAETPYTPCYVRNEFLFDEQKGHGEFTKAVVFAFRAEPARAPMFQVMLDSGACWARVPIHMICSKPCDPLPLQQSSWWDSYGYEFTVVCLAVFEGPCGDRSGQGRANPQRQLSVHCGLDENRLERSARPAQKPSFYCAGFGAVDLVPQQQASLARPVVDYAGAGQRMENA